MPSESCGAAENGQIRLINATIVEMCHELEWRSVCDDSWDDNDARVVCRQLGLPFQGTE